MTPEQRRLLTRRRIDQSDIDKFERALRDGMRPLRLIERGYDLKIIEKEECIMREIVANLKKQLSDNICLTGDDLEEL